MRNININSRDRDNVTKLLKVYGTQPALAEAVNKHFITEGFKCDKSNVSRWQSGNMPVPRLVSDWMVTEVFRNTLYGSVALETKDLPGWFIFLVDGLCRSPESVEAGLEAALRVQAGGDYRKSTKKQSTNTKPWVWAVFAAFIGMLQREQRDLDAAGESFDCAVDLAKEAFDCAVDPAEKDKAKGLIPRYHTNALNIHRELKFKDFSERKITNEEYIEFVESTLTEQKSVLKAAEQAGGLSEKDRAFMLRHIMRMDSILNKKREFDMYLIEARKCEGFGKTPEDRDASLGEMLSPTHDEDNDFGNARRYESTYEIRGVSPERASRSPGKYPRKMVSRVNAILAVTVITLGSFQIGIGPTGTDEPSLGHSVRGGDYSG